MIRLIFRRLVHAASVEPDCGLLMESVWKKLLSETEGEDIYEQQIYGPDGKSPFKKIHPEIYG